MAHFAKVVEGKVTKVIVAEQEFIDNFVDETPGRWIQTSYNTRGGVHYEPNSDTPSEDQSKALRYNYALIGGIYDRINDAFYETQKHASWILNTESFIWEAPIEYPDDGGVYHWNEEAYQADNTEGWELDS
jgi:hypothetical protein